MLTPCKKVPQQRVQSSILKKKPKGRSILGKCVIADTLVWYIYNVFDWLKSVLNKPHVVVRYGFFLFSPEIYHDASFAHVSKIAKPSVELGIPSVYKLMRIAHWMWRRGGAFSVYVFSSCATGADINTDIWHKGILQWVICVYRYDKCHQIVMTHIPDTFYDTLLPCVVSNRELNLTECITYS